MSVPDAARADVAPAAEVPPPLRILVVDDHSTFAELVEIALDLEPDLTCVGRARTTVDAVTMTARCQPDLVLMDVQLADGDGIETTAKLTSLYPDLRVVVLTAHADAEVVRRAAEAGACGFLPKDGALAGLLHALRSARRGSLVLHPEVLSTLANPVPATATALVPVPVLTVQELEVLTMLGRGLSVRMIARNTGLTLEDCRTQLAGVLTKLDARSQLEAVVTANRYGLISLGPA